MSLPFLDGEALARLLPIPDAIEALERAFASLDLIEAPPRSRMDLPEGTLLLMPAHGPEGTGVKVVALNSANPARGLPLVHAVYVLFDPGTSVPRAVVDGAALTALRTSAVSALATRYLAREDASRLVVFGAGVQAAAHLDAMRAVRPISSVRVVSRSPGPAERLAGWARAAGLDAAVAAPEAVADADLVCTCTTSATPVFDGSLLPAGAHVNAVGTYRTDHRELDDVTIGRADIVAVETVEVAMAEAGEIVGPAGSGVIEPGDLVEMSDVVGGKVARRSEAAITVFKSVGAAFEDLAVAAAAVDRV